MPRRTFTITVKPTLAAVADSPLLDTASITGNEFDPDTSNNTSQAIGHDLPRRGPGDRSFTAAPDPLEIGSTLTYTVIVTNHGPSPATAVTLTSPLGTGAGYVTGSGIASPSGTVGLQGSSVVASLGTLASGASATVTFAVIPGVFGPLTASASVTVGRDGHRSLEQLGQRDHHRAGPGGHDRVQRGELHRAGERRLGHDHREPGERRPGDRDGRLHDRPDQCGSPAWTTLRSPER